MWFYRLLLYLYPRSWRAEYGAPILTDYASRRSFLLPFEAIADTVTTAAAVHWDFLRQDLRYAFRTLRKSPGFTAAAVGIAAIGIGATTAAFTLVDHVLIRPLPYRDPGQLVKLWTATPDGGYSEASPANYRDWKRLSHSFQALETYTVRPVNVTRPGEPQPMDGGVVTGGLFSLLGVPPAMGRTISEDDDRESAPSVAVLSYGLWQDRFAGDPGVLGRTLDLDGNSFTVIGVMPPGFFFPARKVAFWTAMRWGPGAFDDREDTYLYPVGRLKPGVSATQAAAEMRLIGNAIAGEFPKEMARTSVRVIPLRDEVPVQSRTMLKVVLGASLCVLLIACTNLANLGLARAMGRRRELAVRTALGAGRDRLLRQMLTESVVVALAGGALGIALAYGALPLLVRLVPTSLPLPEAPEIDARVLLGAFLVTCTTAVVSGLIRPPVGFDALRGGRPRREALRASLVVAEVAASVLLLVSFGLLTRALWSIQAIDPGFRPDHLLTLRTPLPMPRYEQPPVRERFYANVLTGVRRIPGVTQAAYTSFLPMIMRGGIWKATTPGVPDDPANNTVSLRFVTPGFFAAMGVPLLTGRDVEDRDGPDDQFVAVVSASLARRLWPKENPIGRPINVGNFDRVVVGVVGDVKVRGLERTAEPQVYCSWRQHFRVSMWYAPKDLVIRTSGDPTAIAPEVRRIIHQIDPEQPVADVRTMTDVVHAETATRRVQLSVLGVFGAAAFLLAAVGIHSLLAFVVSTRQSEIGVRVALGAQRGDIVRLMLRDGIRLTAFGLAAGVVAASGAGRLLESLLAGVQPDDPATYAAAVAIAAVMTAIGTALPIVRALRVDPVQAIRSE